MKKLHFASVALVMLVIASTAFAHPRKKAEFTRDFRLEDCGFSSTGRNPYFSLEPGDMLILEGDDDGEFLELHITVLSDTEMIQFDTANGNTLSVETRVVEEREWLDGVLGEISRNFFARCEQTNDVYYFGEDVDIYQPDGTITHEGAWRAGVDDALPGVIMPGTFFLGSRYFQEIAPEVAMDRGENIGMSLTVEVPAGLFTDCVEVFETTPLEHKSESTKVYCAGIGLVIDDAAELVGFDVGTP